MVPWVERKMKYSKNQIDQTNQINQKGEIGQTNQIDDPNVLNDINDLNQINQINWKKEYQRATFSEISVFYLTKTDILG